MNSTRKRNPIIIIFIAAVIALGVTLTVVLLMGGRYITLPNGAKFLGEWENGQPTIGKIQYPNGTTAEYNFYEKTIKYDNGDLYVGELDNCYREGNGTMSYYATGDIYEGEFYQNDISGKGVFKYSNGDVYVGEFLNSQKHGSGEFIYANGNRYTGTYENDVRVGKGVFKWASGAVYEGNFENDLKNGSGIMVYESGDRFEGTFKDDMRHGSNCVYSWANNERYNGAFINNLMDTRLLDEKGNFVVDENGNFVHGDMATYTFTTGRTFVGYFVEGKPEGVTIG